MPEFVEVLTVDAVDLMVEQPASVLKNATALIVSADLWMVMCHTGCGILKGWQVGQMLLDDDPSPLTFNENECHSATKHVGLVSRIAMRDMVCRRHDGRRRS
jgi:hypothetical protein